MDDFEVHHVGLKTPHIHNLSDLVQRILGLQVRYSISRFYKSGTQLSQILMNVGSYVVFQIRIVKKLLKTSRNMGTKLRFRLLASRDYLRMVTLEGSKEGVKGPLVSTIEIFELKHDLRVVVVEVKKKSRDMNEYEEFCERELRPCSQPLMLSGSSGDHQVFFLIPLDQEAGVKRLWVFCSFCGSLQ
ncbi:hypothetical protein M8C21_000635, partial [Ambrosia artemisiifolia]